MSENEAVNPHHKPPSEVALSLAREIWQAARSTGNGDSMDVITAARKIEELHSFCGSCGAKTRVDFGPEYCNFCKKPLRHVGRGLYAACENESCQNQGDSA